MTSLVGACGGGDDGGDGGDDGVVEPIPEELLIDDLEDNDGAIPETSGRYGAWFSYNDGTATTQQPDPNGDFVGAEGGPEGSSYYARTTGDSFTEWGAGFGFDLNNTGVDGPSGEGEKKAFDASAYQGVRLMAKGNVDVRVGFLVSAVVETDFGGGCTPPATPTEGQDCGDAHGKVLTLTDDWKEYRIPFTGLTQGGWGIAADFDAATITSVHFDIEQGLTFDVGIDNIGFY